MSLYPNNSGSAFGEGFEDDVSSEYHIKKQMMSIRSITGDVNFDHLAKVLYARFFHSQDTISPFVIYNIGGGKKKLMVSLLHFKCISVQPFQSSFQALSDSTELEREDGKETVLSSYKSTLNISSWSSCCGSVG